MKKLSLLGLFILQNSFASPVDFKVASVKRTKQTDQLLRVPAMAFRVPETDMYRGRYRVPKVFADRVQSALLEKAGQGFQVVKKDYPAGEASVEYFYTNEYLVKNFTIRFAKAVIACSERGEGRKVISSYFMAGGYRIADSQRALKHIPQLKENFHHGTCEWDIAETYFQGLGEDSLYVRNLRRGLEHMILGKKLSSATLSFIFGEKLSMVQAVLTELLSDISDPESQYTGYPSPFFFMGLKEATSEAKKILLHYKNPTTGTPLFPYESSATLLNWIVKNKEAKPGLSSEQFEAVIKNCAEGWETMERLYQPFHTKECWDNSASARDKPYRITLFTKSQDGTLSVYL